MNTLTKHPVNWAEEFTTFLKKLPIVTGVGERLESVYAPNKSPKFSIVENSPCGNYTKIRIAHRFFRVEKLGGGKFPFDGIVTVEFKLKTQDEETVKILPELLLRRAKGDLLDVDEWVKLEELANYTV